MAHVDRVILLFAISFLLACTGSALAQGLHPATLFGSGSQVCGYQLVIPASADCDTYGATLQQKLRAVQQDMDRVKLQFVSQNSVLQDELRQLRQQTSTTDAELTDLRKDYKDLETAVAALQTTIAKTTTNGGTGNTNSMATPTDAMLQQLVTSTRALLTQDLQKVEDSIKVAVNAVRTDSQHDALQQSQVDSAFQSQLRQQQQDLTLVLQRLQQLQDRVKTLATQTTQPRPPATTTPTTTTTTSTSTSQPATTTTAAAMTTMTTTADPMLQKVQGQLQQLDARVSQLEVDYQSDVPELTHNVTVLLELQEVQSLKLSSLEVEAERLDMTEIPALKTRVSTNYDAIAQFIQTGGAQALGPLSQKVQQMAEDVTSLTGQVSRLGTDQFTTLGRVRQDETEIDDLSMQVHMVASRLSNLIRTEGFTTPPPPTTKPPPTTTFAIPTPKP